MNVCAIKNIGSPQLEHFNSTSALLFLACIRTVGLWPLRDTMRKKENKGRDVFVKVNHAVQNVANPENSVCMSESQVCQLMFHIQRTELWGALRKKTFKQPIFSLRDAAKQNSGHFSSVLALLGCRRSSPTATSRRFWGLRSFCRDLNFSSRILSLHYSLLGFSI